MDDTLSPREMMHELGNSRQEKLALQHLLAQAADHIERLAGQLDDRDERQAALDTAANYRRLATG